MKLIYGAFVAALLLAAWDANAQGLSGQIKGGSGGIGTVTSVTCNNGLSGGTFTTTGTCALAPIAATTLLANPTGLSAVPSAITLGSGLSFSGTTLVATGSGGTVTSITCNAGLTGGTITTTGTCALDVAHANNWSAAQTFANGDLQLSGSSSGTSTLEAPATGGGTVTLMPGTDTVAGLGTAQSFTAANTFAEVHGTAYAPTLTSNNYNAASSDCGKTLLLPTGTTPTLTLPNLNAACSIAIVQMTAVQYTVQAASGGTLVSVNSFTKTKGQYAILFLTIIVPSVSAATWDLAGDGA